MSSARSYPRAAWLGRLTFVAVLLTLAVGFGYGIPMFARMHTVVTTANVAKHNEASNRLWQMVAYGDTDDTPLGQLAWRVRDLMNTSKNPNPIRALRDYWVKPNEFPGVESRLLGYNAFYVVDGSSIDATQGPFTNDFILTALQATPETVDDVMQPVPVVPPYGYLLWQWLVTALAAIWALYGLTYWVLRRDRRAYGRRQPRLSVVAYKPPPDSDSAA